MILSNIKEPDGKRHKGSPLQITQSAQSNLKRIKLSPSSFLWKAKQKKKLLGYANLYIALYFKPVTREMSQLGVESEHKHISIPCVNNFFLML
jgi:hypothetical protein